MLSNCMRGLVLASLLWAAAAAQQAPYTQRENVVYGEAHGVGLLMDVFTPSGQGNGLGIIDVISGAKYAAPSWTPDNAGFYYEWLPSGPDIPVSDRPGRTELRYHALGTDPQTDPLVFPSTLDPKTFEKGWDAEVKTGYEIARKIPATLDRLHCFCECAESPMFHHKTLLTCFVDKHAAGCGICLSEARLAWQLKEKGVSDDEIVITVESVHKTDGHPPTH